MKTMASLFAGIGGFDLAGESLGVEVVLQAELEPHAQAVLRERFPKARLINDARHAKLAGVDIVAAGFPCQGLSAAAATPRGQGLFDPDSPSAVIWPALQNIFNARVPFLLLENADSLATARYADDMNALLRALVQNGYNPYVVSLNSGCYGSVMRRTRTFVLARRSEWSRPTTGERVAWTDTNLAIGVNNQQGGAMLGAQPSITKKARSYSLLVTPDEVRSLMPSAVELLFGYPVGWTTAAGSANARYERLGNTVSVDAARAALQMLLVGHAPVRRPDAPYRDRVIGYTTPATGGAAGSAFGRIVRTGGARVAGGRNPNTNTIELDYCVPVYERWMHSHVSEISDAMWGYLAAVKPALPRAKPWPTSFVVEMAQKLRA